MIKRSTLAFFVALCLTVTNVLPVSGMSVIPKKCFDDLDPLKKNRVIHGVELSQTNGKEAAKVLNELVSNEEDFKIGLRKVLDSFFGARTLNQNEFEAFKNTIDNSAKEVIDNYLEAAEERSNASNLNFKTGKLVVNFEYGTPMDDINTIVKNEAVSYELLSDGETHIDEDLPIYKKERLEAIRNYKSDIVILVDISLEDTVDRAKAKFESYDLVKYTSRDICFTADNSKTVKEDNVTKRKNGFLYKVYNGKAEIIDYVGSKVKVSIPESLGKYQVNRIGWGAFKNNSTVKKIKLPQTITAIEEFAFWNCPSLESINIPKSVESIGNFSFACPSLKKIRVNKNNQQFVGSDNMLFNKDKTELIYSAKNKKGEVIIPDGVEYIGMRAFEDSKEITSIKLPSSIIYAGSYNGCSLLEEIQVAEGSQTYASQDGLLLNKEKTMLYVIPEGKKGVLTIPEGVEEVVFSFPQKHRKITEINLPASLTGSIEVLAFRGFKALKEINVDPNNPTYSSKNNVLFNKDGTKLIYVAGKGRKKYTVPKVVKEITPGAFMDCDSMTNLKVEKENTKFISKKNVLFSSDGKKLVYSIETKKNYTVPAKVRQIYDYAFYENNKLNRVVIPKKVNRIGRYAFYGNDKLKKLKIKGKVKRIEEYAFSNCKALKNYISLPPYLDITENQGMLEDEGYSGLAIRIRYKKGKRVFREVISQQLGIKIKHPTPKKKGKRFVGWYSKAKGGYRITNSFKFNRNTTLYARFK